jgi:hypothetical protein
MLLPYIISTKSIYAGSKIRVFALASAKNNLEVEEAGYVSLIYFHFHVFCLSLCHKIVMQISKPAFKIPNEVRGSYCHYGCHEEGG